MLPASRALFPDSWLWCLFLIVLNLCIGSVWADDESTTAEEAGSPLIIGKPVTKTFNIEDIDRVEFGLKLPGSIEVVTTTENVVTVTLEKQARATYPEQAELLRDYLDNVTLVSARKAAVLQVEVQVPITVPKSVSDRENATVVSGYQGFLLKCEVQMPADLSVDFRTDAGDIRLQGIRGKIAAATRVGDVYLDETLGSYDISVTEGDISGQILLTHGQNRVETRKGSIALMLLDSVAAPMDITAQGGSIRLQMPENYAADVEFESGKRHIVVNLPAQVDLEAGVAAINEGGPLFRLKATDSVSLLSTQQSDEAAEVEPFGEFVQPVPYISEPPVIDGDLSEIAWHAAALLEPFQNPEGTEVSSTLTETFLMWDAENFYIGVKAYVPQAYLPYISQTQHDSPIWEDECIEFLIDSVPETESYYHLVVNPIRAIFDQRVDTAGAASFQFAPQDVQRTLDRKAMRTAFAAEASWDSAATVATRIDADFWSVEIALPRNLLEPPADASKKTGETAGDRWLFNVHRKAHGSNTKSLIPAASREYSYWQPIYDGTYPWWPHSPQEYVGSLSGRSGPAMGILEFLTPPVSAEGFASEVKFQVDAIEIKGNITVPTAVIQRSLPIQEGDIIATSHLSWLIAELQQRAWFEDVRLETEQVAAESEEVSDVVPRVRLRIRVTEVPLLFAESVKIEGNRTFPTQFIAEWFQLESGYLTVENVRLKRRLIADFYVNRGYDFATVAYQSIADVLKFRIDEGTLHEIRFTGNTRVSRAELLAALDIDTVSGDSEDGSQPPDIYSRALGQSKINRMEQELRESNPYFKSVEEWNVQREGGKNVMVIAVAEQRMISPSIFPVFQFNRVHGLMVGAGGVLTTQLTGKEQIFGSVSRGFSSEIWNYHAGVEKSFFARHQLSLGGGFYKLTDVGFDGYLSPVEVSLSAAYYGFSLLNYYQRQGSQGWVTYVPSGGSYLRAEFTAEGHQNLSKSTDWSYLNRDRLKRGNPRINRGQLRSLSFIYAFDTRDHKSKATRHFHTLFSANERAGRGWRGHVDVAIAGQAFGGDHSFNTFGFEVARYTPLYGPHHLNVRVAGDFADTPLPRQQLFYLGGASTLRGYSFNAFAGDNRVILNLEYRFMAEILQTAQGDVLGGTLSCFLDTGNVWWYGETPFSGISDFMTQLKASVGIGGSIFVDPAGDRDPLSFSVELARPLDSATVWQTPRIILRLERMF